MARAVVIANCHCLPIARTLSLGLSLHEIEFVDLNFIDREPYASRVERLYTDPADFVFSFFLRDKWGTLNTADLKILYGEKLVTFSNLYFSGLHPDITYIGAMGTRVKGFLTDYHSKLILYAFATGRSPHDCQELFQGNIYEKAGYFELFQTSASELRERDRDVDVQFSDPFTALVKQQCSLYTVNHPTDVVFRELCSAICKVVDFKFNSYPDSYYSNYLCENVIWPVYNEIAEFHSLAYRTPQEFITRHNFVGRSFTLRDTIDAFYSVYNLQERSDFVQNVKNLAFFSHLLASVG